MRKLEICDLEGFKTLFKSLFTKRADLAGLADLSPATLGRLLGKAHYPMDEDTALKLHSAMVEQAKTKAAPPPDVFEAMFKVCTAPAPKKKVYSWQKARSAAEEVGEYVFDKFQADVILTFAGHGAIFANAVLALTPSLMPRKFLNVPVYLAMVRDTESSPANQSTPDLPGFVAVPKKAFTVFVPTALAEGDPNHRKRIAIIDDVVASGVVPQALREYFRGLGYKDGEKDGQIKVACWLRHEGSTFEADRKPDHFVESAPRNFELPWGDPVWFPYEHDKHDDA